MSGTPLLVPLDHEPDYVFLNGYQGNHYILQNWDFIKFFSAVFLKLISSELI